MKSILIEEEIHQQLKDASKKTGIKIKVLTETAIRFYIARLVTKEEENGRK